MEATLHGDTKEVVKTQGKAQSSAVNDLNRWTQIHCPHCDRSHRVGNGQEPVGCQCGAVFAYSTG